MLWRRFFPAKTHCRNSTSILSSRVATAGHSCCWGLDFGLRISQARSPKYSVITPQRHQAQDQETLMRGTLGGLGFMACVLLPGYQGCLYRACAAWYRSSAVEIRVARHLSSSSCGTCRIPSAYQEAANKDIIWGLPARSTIRQVNLFQVYDA